MLSLDLGGQCEGVVFRLAPETAEDDLVGMLETEPPVPPIWVDVETTDGTVRCIAHVCPRSFIGYEGDLDPEQIAERLHVAVGMYGSMPDYLYNTVCHLEDQKIHDPYLWHIQELVAARLSSQCGKKDLSP